MGKRRAGGDGPKFSSAKRVDALVDAYFRKCRGELMTEEATGNPLLDKKGKPVYDGDHPPTLSGLALALGFTSKAALLRYRGKPEIEAALMRGRSRVEQYAEELLYDKECSAGAKFVLEKVFGEEEYAGDDAADEDILAEVRARLEAVACDEP